MTVRILQVYKADEKEWRNISSVEYPDGATPTETRERQVEQAKFERYQRDWRNHDDFKTAHFRVIDKSFRDAKEFKIV